LQHLAIGNGKQTNSEPIHQVILPTRDWSILVETAPIKQTIGASTKSSEHAMKTKHQHVEQVGKPRQQRMDYRNPSMPSQRKNRSDFDDSKNPFWAMIELKATGSPLLAPIDTADKVSGTLRRAVR
jgi:hypothetical protein